MNLKMRNFLIFLVTVISTNLLAQPKTIHIFGDSLFAVHNHGVAQELSELFNWPTETVSIKDYSKLGATVSMIESQYYSAKDVKLAVINGGANDILLDFLWCYTKENQSLSYRCKAIIRSLIADSLAHLITQMHNDGVQDILVLTSYHMRYPNTLLNQAIDYSVSVWTETCLQYDCKLIDMRQYVDPQDTKFYWIDGSHPSELGSRRVARLIYFSFKN